MKFPFLLRISLLFFLMFLGSGSLRALEVEGTWQGRMMVLFYSQDLRLVFHFGRDSVDHTLVGSMEVPDQGIEKMDLDVEATDDSLFLSIPEISAEFVGKYNPDSAAFFGIFKQSGIKFPLKLIKGEANDLVYYRPQKPKKPYPYHEEEVTIENKSSKLTLAGTFTKPEGKGKFPAVILITGSGPEDRDETIVGHKPFLILADYLTRKGFAVLRCDDRGTAKSTGDFAGTSADYATDVVVQIDYLKTRKDVDLKKIGLLGHSEGGIIAPLAAAPRKDVAFLVLYAAPAVDLYNLLITQDSLILASEGRGQKEITASREKNTKIYQFIRSTPDSATAADSIDLYLRGMNAHDMEIAATLRQMDGRWMRWYSGYDPRETLAKIQCPVLAINGEKDVQVPARENIDAIQQTLTKNGNKNFKTLVLPGLNHLFQKCKKCTTSEYVLLEETLNQSALEVTGTWMVENILNKK